MTVSSDRRQFLSGLTTAMFLFLIASGLSLVFGVMRVLNFAHGSFYMIGAYMAWQVVTVAAADRRGVLDRRARRRAGVALLGGIVERLLLRHLYGLEELYQLLFTYALVLILGDAAKFIWGTEQLSVRRPPVLDGGFSLLRHDAALLQSVHHGGWPGDRHLRRAATEPQRGRADAACRSDDREMLGALGRECRRALYRDVRRQLLPCRVSPAR